MAEKLDAIFQRLAAWQAERPERFIALALVLALASVPLVLQLGLKGALTALLPEEKSSVRDLHEVKDRFGVASNLTIAVFGDIPTARRFADSAADALAEAEIEHVTAIDHNIKPFIDFVEKRFHLYVPYDDLERIRDRLDARLQWETADKNPLFVRLDDEEPPDVEALVDELKEEQKSGEHRIDRFPGGYFQHKEKDVLIMFVRNDVDTGAAPVAEKLLGEVQNVVSKVQKSDPEFEKLKVEYAGDMMDVLVETRELQKEIFLSTVLTIVLVLFAIYLFFQGARSIPILFLSLLPPVIMTFAFAELKVDYLNTSTAFLGSIVIGNGVNPNIIWLARYFELRRRGMPIQESLFHTHRSSWQATLAASAAAGLAYASLIVTDFRGFRDFGWVGGMGMLLCWLSAFVILPAWASWFDNRNPIKVQPEKASRNIYGILFAKLAFGAPRPVLIVSLLLTIGASGIVYQAIVDDPMEYDFRKLQSERDPADPVKYVNDLQATIVDETTAGSSIAILVPKKEYSTLVKEQLEKHEAENPKTIGRVVIFQDLIPKDQEDKIEVLEEIRGTMLKMREHASEKQLEKIDEFIPPEEVEEIGEEDLPPEIKKTFTEREGEVGRIIFVEHAEGRNQWDGKYMLAWAEAARSVRLPDGSRPPVTGRPPVFADLLDSILIDGPKAVVVALSVTSLLLFFVFGTWRLRFLSLFSLLSGILWMAGLMAVLRIKLNFLNFVAFPITFGNGVDYSVNVLKRYAYEEAHDAKGDQIAAIRTAIEATGGAVVLCSLTTIIGYISLYTSSNQALNSFGSAMAISEITCVATAVVALPAWLAKKRA